MYVAIQAAAGIGHRGCVLRTRGSDTADLNPKRCPVLDVVFFFLFFFFCGGGGEVVGGGGGRSAAAGAI